MKGLLGFSPDCGSSQSVPCIRHHQYYSPTTACSSPLAAVTTRIRGRQQEEETFVSCCYETMPMYCVMRQVVPGPDIRYGHREQSPGGDNGKAPPHQAAPSLLTFSADTGRGMGGEGRAGAGSQPETKKALKINCQDLRHLSLITASTSRHPRPRSGDAVKCYLVLFTLSTLSTLSVCTTGYKYLLSSLCAQSGSGWNIHEKMLDNANV